jgi:hypothetical protein
MYLDPEHRDPKAIQLLAKAGIDKAEEMKVTDIDLLVCAEQTGMHALLKKWGFKQQAFQFCKHYTIDSLEELPDLHQPLPELEPPPEGSPLTPLEKGGTSGSPLEKGGTGASGGTDFWNGCGMS